VTASLTRRYGETPKGERCLDHAPHGHWHTNIFITALRSDRGRGCLALGQPDERRGLPALRPRSVGSDPAAGRYRGSRQPQQPKVAGVREAVAARGAQIIFLPPFSPDLNPIENFFAKLKALLRKAAERHFDAPVGRIKIILENVTTTNAPTTSSPPDTLRHESKTL